MYVLKLTVVDAFTTEIKPDGDVEEVFRPARGRGKPSTRYMIFNLDR